MPTEIELSEVQEPLVEADIARAERELGLRLPDELRTFLLTYSGGRPVADAFDDALGRDCSAVDGFFAIGHRFPSCDLVVTYQQMRGRVPDELLPFADDPFSNLICLGIAGAARGKVYFWDHESEPAIGPDEDNDPSEWPDGVDPWIDDRDPWGAVTLVADSFEAFLAKLYEWDLDDDDRIKGAGGANGAGDDAAARAQRVGLLRPVAGRMPVNYQYAGKMFTGKDVTNPEAHAEAIERIDAHGGIRFTGDGFPELEAFIYQAPGIRGDVTIELTGRRDKDLRLADKVAGFTRRNRRPKGYAWHHHHEEGRMILVPEAVHRTVGHAGGVARYKHRTGDLNAYRRD